MVLSYNVIPRGTRKHLCNFDIVADKQEVALHSGVTGKFELDRGLREYFGRAIGSHEPAYHTSGRTSFQYDVYSADSSSQIIPVYLDFDNEEKIIDELGILANIRLSASTSLRPRLEEEHLPYAPVGSEDEFSEKNHVWIADRVTTQENRRILEDAFLAWANC
jgi:hypothetical protein